MKYNYDTPFKQAQAVLSHVRTEAYLITDKAEYFAWHNADGDLSIIVCHKDGAAQQYDFKGSWQDIITDKNVFSRKIREFILRNKNGEQNRVLENLRLEYAVYGRPQRIALGDSVVSLELFMSIWGKMGRCRNFVDKSFPVAIHEKLVATFASPRQKAMDFLKDIRIQAEQQTDKAAYYAWHNPDGNLSIVICHNDGRAQLYKCKGSWQEILNNRIFWLRYDERRFDTETVKRIHELRYPTGNTDSFVYDIPLGLDSPISLEMFIRIWGRKGVIQDFERCTRHEVAKAYLEGVKGQVFIGRDNTVYSAFHEQGNLSVMVIYTDGRAMRYDCKGSWEEIINGSEWFWKRALDYIRQIKTNEEWRVQLGERILQHVLYGNPITHGMGVDDIITIELFMKIWDNKGKYTEIMPLLK